MRLTIISLLFWLLASSAFAELKVMAINTEWLWTPHDHQVDGRIYNQGDMSERAYEQELNFYAALIQHNGSQIIAVSEIERDAVAHDLASRIGPDWRAYFKQGRDTATGQDVAILSNLDYIKGSITDFNFPSGALPGSVQQKRLSKVLGARFKYRAAGQNQQVAVITAHFLSKRNESKRKSNNRQRQARALVKAIKTFSEYGNQLVVLGDFNDFLGSPTLSILQKEGELESIEQNMADMQLTHPKYRKKSIDHILYRGLTPQDYQRIDLKSYSDHFAVYAQFR